MKPSILYISYDGILEPLGQSQVLAYLEKLAPRYRIHLISYEKKADWKMLSLRAAVAKRIADAGISWHPLRYHKTPSAAATAYDIAVGTLAALAITKRRKIEIIHARSYVAALIALAIKRVTGARFLFDMRGFWADERVDGGLWPEQSRLYRVSKRLERSFLEAADHVVTLTHASAAEISRFEYLKKPLEMSVIPTCADIERFRPSVDESSSHFTLGYVGSVGTWYLFDESLECFKIIAERDPQARLLIVNRNEHTMIMDCAARIGVDKDRIELVSAEHWEVPRLIARMTAGAAIIKPTYSKMASAPTKLAEYLGCGVPCLGNVNVGDLREILEGERVGIALTGFSDAERRSAVDRLFDLVADPSTSARCVETANRLFSLSSGVHAYDGIYQRLSGASASVQGAVQ